MFRKAFVFGLLISFCFIAGKVRAGQLEDIRARGVLVVGTKADYEPFGYLDPRGNVIGLEPDLAADLARRLHVGLKIVPVLSSNRVAALQSGQVDIILATMSITPERRKLVAFIDPPYYASGAGVLHLRSARVEETGDLVGKSVCAVEGNIFLTQLRSQFPGIKTDLYKDLLTAEMALLSQRCEALYFDDVPLFYRKISQPERFQDFEFEQLLDADPLLWGAAVKLGEEQTSWGRFVAEAITDWHRSGFLLEVERRWIGANTVLLKALNKKWTLSAQGSR